MADRKGPVGRPSSRWRRRLFILGVGVCAAFIIKWWVFDLYLVVEESMFPVLRGGTDRILVQKLARSPRRFDIWLYRSDEGDRRPFVKRLVGFEGEWIDLVGGDVLVGSASDNVAPISRPTEIMDRMWLPVPPVPGDESWCPAWEGAPVPKRADRGWRVDGGSEPVEAWWVGNGGGTPWVTDDHRGPDGASRRGEHGVPDVRIEVAAVVPRGATLSVTHDLAGESADRTVAWAYDHWRLQRGRHADWQVLPRPAGASRLRIETLDGQFRILSSDTDSGPWEELLVEPRDTRTHGSLSRVGIIAEGGCVQLAAFQVMRDIHWEWPIRRRASGPYRIDRGFFMLGDNGAVSEDSRHHGPVAQKRLVGKAAAILWPNPRVRSLP